MLLPKRLITAIAIFSCSLMGFISNASADKVDDVINAGKVRGGVVLDFPPIGYRDQDNNPAGFDVTLTTKQTTQLI